MHRRKRIGNILILFGLMFGCAVWLDLHIPLVARVFVYVAAFSCMLLMIQQYTRLKQESEKKKETLKEYVERMGLD